MQTFFEDYLERLGALHAQIGTAIEDLPQEALDWVPGEGMNSLSVLVVHTTGSESYWIGEVAGGRPSGRDRDAEFRAHGLTEADLRRRLADGLESARSVLEDLTLQDLERERISPRDGRRLTVGWALAHALEHTGLHLGHIQITRQLWDQRGSLSQASREH
jgi:uncharacterized damage-inducible protein DinB